jgi:tripartite-type tricarboxylate transporter receptor subunit TctC
MSHPSKRALRTLTWLPLAVVTGLMVAGMIPANAQSVERFYAGKILKFVVPDGAGGGYDAYARLLARHLADHIPGRPRIVTENMPGAAGLVATNWMYRLAPRDGSVMSLTYNTLLTDALLGDAAAQYDPTKFGWIGSTSTQFGTCMVWDTSSIKTIDDARMREVRVATTGLTGNSAKLPRMLNTLLGTKFMVIAGYTSSGMRLAVERGEVEGICGVPYDSYAAAEPEWLKDGKIRFILQTGTAPAKSLPGVPLLTDFVTDPETRAAIKVLGVDQSAGRPQFFPPGVPSDLLEALRIAFNETIKDPKFVADAAAMRIDLEPETGDQIASQIERVYAAPKNVIALAAKLWPVALPKKEDQ